MESYLWLNGVAEFRSGHSRACQVPRGLFGLQTDPFRVGALLTRSVGEYRLTLSTTIVNVTAHSHWKISSGQIRSLPSSSKTSIVGKSE
jgi:hypothetical protein